MAENTKIEWCDSTFNPWLGCTKVSPACDNCYAENLMDKRMGVVQWGAGQPRKRTSVKNWNLPIKWNKQRFMQCGLCGWRGECNAELIGCGNCGSSDCMNDTRRRVFCASLADVFDNEVDPAWRADLFELIAATPNLDWLLLTKRIGNAKTMMADALHLTPSANRDGRIWPLPNVWLGATVVNQEEADRDIPKLLDVPARVRFLSMEPLLGPVDLRALQYGEGEIDALKPYQWEDVIAAWRDTTPEWVEDFEDWFGVTLNDGLSGPMHAALDWVIVGGESGHGARPMHPDWVRSIRDQCEAAGVPFLFKQWGEHVDFEHIETAWWNSRTEADRRRLKQRFVNGTAMVCIGKHAAGRLLDGRTHDGVPA